MAPPDEIVTATGWRIVGRAVDLVSDVARAGLAPPVATDIALAATFRLRPRLGANAADAVLGLLDAAIRRTWSDVDPVSRHHAFQRTAGRAHAAHWDVAADGERWTGELLWRHPHPLGGTTACTTHLILAEQSGATLLGIQVGVAGGARSAGGIPRPAFLADLPRATLAQRALHEPPHGYGCSVRPSRSMATYVTSRRARVSGLLAVARRCRMA